MYGHLYQMLNVSDKVENRNKSAVNHDYIRKTSVTLKVNTDLGNMSRLYYKVNRFIQNWCKCICIWYGSAQTVCLSLATSLSGAIVTVYKHYKLKHILWWYYRYWYTGTILHIQVQHMMYLYFIFYKEQISQWSL